MPTSYRYGAPSALASVIGHEVQGAPQEGSMEAKRKRLVVACETVQSAKAPR